MNEVSTLSKLVTSFGVSGYEWVEGGIAQTIQSIVVNIGTRIGNNLVYRIGNGKRKILLSTHMDEVGFMLTEKKLNYCRITPIGSIDLANIINQQLVFYPKIKSNRINKASNYSELKIQFKKQPNIGDIGTYDKVISYKNNIFISPCLDNRVGCLGLILTYLLIKNSCLRDRTIYLCFSSQEEQRANGIMCAVRKINPDICIDVDSAYAQPIKNRKTRKNWIVPIIGAGPAVQLLGKDYILTFNNRKTVEKIANKINIPLQYEIPDNESGGTYARTLTNNGYETIQINIPVAFQHSSKSKVSINDIILTSSLLKEVISNI